jgi:hypothetical protein
MTTLSIELGDDPPLDANCVTRYAVPSAFIRGQLRALLTAGFNKPTYSGPQIQLIGAPLWDRYVRRWGDVKL